jgi:homoserine kinase
VSVDHSDDWTVRSAGAPADDRAVDLLHRIAGASGDRGPLVVDIESDIPQARGLGSSAAVIVAATAAVRSLIGSTTDRLAVYRIAAAVEGHPDNVAAAVYGGVTAAGPSGAVRQLTLHRSLHPLVAVPESYLFTDEARRVVARPIEVAVASRTASRLLYLIEGMRTGDPDLLAEAASDELHELPRAPLSPLTVRLMETARAAGALHVAWSGAGPSAMALVTSRTKAAVTAAWEELLAHEGGNVLAPEVASTGLVVEG